MGTVPNKIVIENALTGNPASEWDINGAGDWSIEGFATTISVNLGETIFFRVNTDATSYYLDIYRLGYYNGDGARFVKRVYPSASLPQSQPSPVIDPSTGLNDYGDWGVSASWAVPGDATSGIYIARLVRDTGGASHIIFIVRDDDGHSDLLFQTSDTTWHAYNGYGGNSLYQGPKGKNDVYLGNENGQGRAYKVSYNRPFRTREEKLGFLFYAEYPMVRWLEANGYDVSYFTGVDSDLRGSKILEHKVFLSVGHDEYWSAGQRANVEAARDAGVHLAFFSGNEVFWKTRWEDSIDGLATTHRTLVCYKETHANAKIDPTAEWTGTWRDPRFSPPADGGRPENALTGTIFTVFDDPMKYALNVPAAYSKMRLWRNTDIAALAPGDIATFPVGTLGFEWDGDLDNGFRPAGLVHFSSTTLDVDGHLFDFGSNYAAGRATHHVTLYRHSSGALVFGSGTVQWAWGLDKHHDTDYYKATNYWVDVMFTTALGSPPQGLWNATMIPGTPASGDPSAVELGVKFRSDVDGYITGIRFYKGNGNTGSHVGRLWTSTGTKLAEANFISETASGWQEVTFAAHVAITANTTYVASYYAPAGQYAFDELYFKKELVSPPLRAPASNPLDGNGGYQYGPGGFPIFDILPLDPDLRMQQATVNLFADMGVQSGTLQAGLTAATRSTDTTAPISMITSPTDGSTVQICNPITITGTASDADGVVGNVEVSVDGGTTWHPATGSTMWSYTWLPSVLGPVTIKSRAVDDSANLESPSIGVIVMVGPNAGLHSLFYDATTSQVSTGQLDSSGTYTNLKDYSAGTFGLNWTHVVGTNCLLFFYNAANGQASTGQLDSSGTYTNLKDYPVATFKLHWTFIVTDR